ncbi:MAG: substrate-binding domain-containing protein [Zoogloeaceae bacterium]|nr:substrate-binding domain-containing protein [Zoogloeaceae bacterium]
MFINPGRIGRPIRALILAVVPALLGGCLSGEDTPELVIHVDKALSGPLAQIVENYREAHDDDLPYEIRLVVGDSAELRARITGEELPQAAPSDEPLPPPGADADAATEKDAKESDAESAEDAPRPERHPDLFLPLDAAEIGKLGALAGRAKPVAELIPTVAVYDKFEKGIKTFADLTAPNVRLAIGHPDKLPIGATTQALIARLDDPAAFRRHVIYETDTDDDLVHLLKAGWADAAIIWAHQAKPLDAAKYQVISIPDGLAEPRPISIVELTDSPMAQAAAEFADYLAIDANREIFAGRGFGEPKLVNNESPQ